MANEGENALGQALPIWYWLFMFAGAGLIVRVAWEVQQSAGQKALPCTLRIEQQHSRQHSDQAEQVIEDDRMRQHGH